MAGRTHKLSESERLLQICEAIEFCRRARARGAPVASYTRALREAVHFLWERNGRAKRASAAFRSCASLDPTLAANGLVYDHAIPFRLLQDELLGLERATPDAVRPLLERGTLAVLITRAEDHTLTGIGLQSRMPADWDGQDSLARYKAAGIAVVANEAHLLPPLLKPSPPFTRATKAAAMPLTQYGEHPKFQASASRVQTACRAVCDMLTDEGFQLSPNKARDGFTFEGPSGQTLRIDPKVEKLRIRIGTQPGVRPPAELVHGGNQPDWIVVDPATLSIAVDYLRALVRARAR